MTNKVSGAIFAAVAAIAMMPITGFADDLGAQPAEYPPVSYSGAQYVDSKGCVFIRAGFAAAPTWIPRVGLDKNQLCGYKPTFASAPVLPVVADPAPVAPTAPAGPAKPAAPVVVAAAPAAVAAPVVKTAPKVAAPATVAALPPACQGGSALSSKYINDGSKYEVRCDSQAGAILTYETRTVPAGTTLQTANGPMITTAPTVIRVPVAADIKIPEGYQAAFKDDRLNPQRGPRTATGDAQMAQVWTEELPRKLVTVPVQTTQGATVVTSSRNAPAAVAQPVASGHRYVQVGAFGVEANANAAVRKIQSLGLSAARSKGNGLSVILAGPFASSAELSQALAALRAAGYSDAFTRR